MDTAYENLRHQEAALWAPGTSSEFRYNRPDEVQICTTPTDCEHPVYAWEEEVCNTPSEREYPVFAGTKAYENCKTPSDEEFPNNPWSAQSFPQLPFSCAGLSSAGVQFGQPVFNFSTDAVIRLVNHLPATCTIIVSLADGMSSEIKQFKLSLERDALLTKHLAKGLDLTIAEVSTKYKYIVNGRWDPQPEILTGSDIDGAKIILFGVRI